MTDKMKGRLYTWLVFTGFYLVMTLFLLCIGADFFLMIILFFFWAVITGITCLVFGFIPGRGNSFFVDNYLNEEPIDTRDESDIFDEALGLKQPEEREKTFDELIAKKPKDIPHPVLNDAKH